MLNSLRNNLNSGTKQLSEPVQVRLVRARKSAIKRHAALQLPAKAKSALFLGGNMPSTRLQVWLPSLLIVIFFVVAAGLYQGRDNFLDSGTELDAQLLADELPINAYLDKTTTNPNIESN